MVTTPLDGPAAQHIDRIVGEVIAGVPGRPAEVRLLCAADLAELLEGRA
jgi:hypothetical protein